MSFAEIAARENVSACAVCLVYALDNVFRSGLLLISFRMNHITCLAYTFALFHFAVTTFH